MAMILEGRGSHFDPQLIDALCACEPRFVEIASTWRD
jgi:putative two-component system response regulator